MNTSHVRFLATLLFANAVTLLVVYLGLTPNPVGVAVPPVSLVSSAESGLVSTLRAQAVGSLSLASTASVLMPPAAATVLAAVPAPRTPSAAVVWESSSFDPEDVGDAPGGAEWVPPDWFPEDARAGLWALEGLGGPAEVEGRPKGAGRLYSRAAFVYDLDSGRVLLAYGADERLPVASLTKMVSALALMSEQPDLDAELCLDRSVMPSWPGASSRMRVGDCLRGWDLLGAALVRSDNGAAVALAQVSGLPLEPFVGRMNEISHDLGMEQSTFADPSGVWDDNLSTARDMTRAAIAVALHPTLSPVASAPYWTVEYRDKQAKRLGTTNSLIDQPGVEFLAAKTGYTDTARHCFSAVLRTRSGRTLAITTLGASRGRYRWSDVRNLLAWAERR